MTHDASDQDVPTLGEMKKLFVNNPDLEEIGAYLGQFNPIKTMGMERMEIRHSAILAWLLNPQETHGLRDTFLKGFLSAALREHDAPCPSALDVSQADMTDAEVRREWRKIDILVLSPRNGWVFVVENKFHSKQHSNQLKRYMKVATKEFTGRHIQGIFLTLEDEEPEDARYAPINYTTICELIEQIILSGSMPLTKEVEIFVRHYLDVIKEATGMSDERDKVERLAKKLYRDHKQVLDFVVKHGTGNGFSFACEDLFGDGSKDDAHVEIEEQYFVHYSTTSNKVRFLPKSWYDAFHGRKYYWHGCTKWEAGFPVICWLKLRSNNRLQLNAEVGRLSEYDFRKALIEAITETASSKGLKDIYFGTGAVVKGSKRSRFFWKDNSMFNIEDVSNSEEIAKGMKELLKKFRPVFEALAEPMGQFIEYGKESPE